MEPYGDCIISYQTYIIARTRTSTPAWKHPPYGSIMYCLVSDIDKQILAQVKYESIMYALQQGKVKNETYFWMKA